MRVQRGARHAGHRGERARVRQADGGLAQLGQQEGHHGVRPLRDELAQAALPLRDLGGVGRAHELQQRRRDLLHRLRADVALERLEAARRRLAHSLLGVAEAGAHRRDELRQEVGARVAPRRAHELGEAEADALPVVRVRVRVRARVRVGMLGLGMGGSG